MISEMREKNQNEKDEKKIAEIIAACPLFEDIDVSMIHPFYREYRRREEISELVDGVLCVGILGDGEADVYTVSDTMMQQNVSTQRRGAVFGFCNVYIEDAMPTKLVCKVGCEVVFIPKSEFRALVMVNDLFRERYLTLCNQKILSLAQKIDLMGAGSCAGKFACYLLRNADKEGRVTLETSKEQFAKYLNVGRASLFRTIADFSAKGLILQEENSFLILDRNGLLEMKKGE